jgi:SHS2 domain-containing protein
MFNSESEEYIIQSKSWGQRFNPEIHEMRTEIKAITYSYLELKKDQIKQNMDIFDIKK